MIDFEHTVGLTVIAPLDYTKQKDEDMQMMIDTIIGAIRSDKHTKANIEEIATQYPNLCPLLMEVVKRGFRHHKRYLNTIMVLK